MSYVITFKKNQQLQQLVWHACTMRSHQQSTMGKTCSTGAELAGVTVYGQYESKLRFVNNSREWCYWCRKFWWIYSVNVAVKFPFQLLGCVCWLLISSQHAQTAMFSSSYGANNHLWAWRSCIIVNKTAKLKTKTKTKTSQDCLRTYFCHSAYQSDKMFSTGCKWTDYGVFMYIVTCLFCDCTARTRRTRAWCATRDQTMSHIASTVTATAVHQWNIPTASTPADVTQSCRSLDKNKSFTRVLLSDDVMSTAQMYRNSLI